MSGLLTFTNFIKTFPDDKAVIDHYITVRYGGHAKCNHCGSEKVYQYKKRPKIFHCNSCNNTFSVFKGTIFEKTRTPMVEWYFAIHLLFNAKKGISGRNLERIMGGTSKRSFRMLNQIRKAFKKQNAFYDVNGVYEADEVYCNRGIRKQNVRDKNRFNQALQHDNTTETMEIVTKLRKDSNAKFKKRKETESKQGRGTNKMAIIGIINPETKQVYAKVVNKDDKGVRFSRKRVNEFVGNALKGVNPTLITDEFEGYDDISKLGIRHIRINHSIAYHKNGVNTNAMEGFWATVERMLMGTYHYVSPELLQTYVDECVFRYNHRKDKTYFKDDAFSSYLKRTVLV